MNIKAKVIAVAATVSLLPVVLTSCYVGDIPFPFETSVDIFNDTQKSYDVFKQQLNVEDQSNSSEVQADTSLIARFSTAASAERSSLGLAKKAGPKQPTLDSGLLKLNFFYTVNLSTGEGTANGEGRAQFGGKRGGTWCFEFDATMTGYGEKIMGTYKVLGGTGVVGKYTINGGTIDGAINFNDANRLTLNIAGKAKALKKAKKPPKICNQFK